MDHLKLSDIPGLRCAMSRLGMVVAEVDLELRYVWIDNAHPDFDPAQLVGKRDDELLPRSQAAAIMALKQESIRSGAPVTRTLKFTRSDGERAYSMSAYPVRDELGRVVSLFTVGFDATVRGPLPQVSSQANT